MTSGARAEGDADDEGDDRAVHWLWMVPRMLSMVTLLIERIFYF
jgi:hypothetical protein